MILGVPCQRWYDFTFADLDAEPAELRNRILEVFPKLNGVQFEVLRCVGGGWGKPLVRISNDDDVPSARMIKLIVRSGIVYIRPFTSVEPVSE